MSMGSMRTVRGRKRIHVTELQVGMFVSDLDRDWLETPFVMQGFRVNSKEDIETVKRYCQHVWIDTLTWEYRPGSEKPDIQRAPRPARHAYVNATSTVQEHKAALGIHQRARGITRTLLDEARLGYSVNTELAKETVKSCVESVIRNPDAMLWMTRIRKESEYTAEHCLNVCVLAIAYGRHMGFIEEQLNKLGLCGLLHDVGKMKIPPEILDKTGKLTDKEFRIMKTHTVHGRNLLMSAAKQKFHGVVDVAYSHHERIDGSGYPRGLMASGISVFSRIIGIVDAYDAMTTARCYEHARPSTDALKELYRCRGTHFDALLVEQFIEMIGLYPPGSIVELANGCVGIVFDTHSKYSHLPKVLLVRDENKQPAPEKVVSLDLTETGELDKSFLIKHVITDGTYGVTLQDYKDKGLQVNFG